MIIHKSVSTIKDMMIIIYISQMIYKDKRNEIFRSEQKKNVL